MTTHQKRGPLDGFSPEMQAAIREHVQKIVDVAPSLTEDQKQLIKQLFSPYRRPAQTEPGDAA